MKNALLNSALYKNRHIVGFFAVAVIIYFFIVFGFARTPAGLSPAEMNSAILSAGFSFPDSIIDLPYNFLQWLSTTILGMSTFALRLPSVILALFASGLIIAAIRNFTRSNVAIITGLIMSCGAFFLNFAHSGTPEVMGVFLMSLAVFAISQITTKRSFQTLWLTLLSVAVTLGIYMPGGIVFFVVLLAVAFISPKSREILKSLKIWQVIIASVLGLVALTPLVLSIVANPDLLWVALGINTFTFEPKEILINLQAMFSPFGADFNGYVTPILSFGEIALAILGIIKLISDGKSARTAFTLTIAAVALIITIFSPAKAGLMFVPWVFLMAFGVAFIIDHWYKLFPLNPYARVLGMIPIGVFIAAMMIAGRTSYVDANFYDKKVTEPRNIVFEAAREEINSLSAHKINLVVPEQEIEFYGLLESSYPELTVTNKVYDDHEIKILTPGTYEQIGSTPNKIVTSSHKEGAVLLKIYQR